jgi:hypothetical protein
MIEGGFREIGPYQFTRNKFYPVKRTFGKRDIG